MTLLRFPLQMYGWVGTGWDGTEYGVALHWNGDHWESFSEGESFTNHSISALSSDDIWAITNHSVVWHWDGSAWTEIDLTTDIYPVDPNIIDFIDVPGGRSSELWLLDSSGIIYTVNLYWLDFGN